MEDIRRKFVPPAIDQSAFNCPHCGALATQCWYSVYAGSLDRGRLPFRIDESGLESLDLSHIEDEEARAHFREMLRRAAKGRPFLREDLDSYHSVELLNVSLSLCFNCNDVGLWINNSLVWPTRGEAPLPNPDLPDQVRRDYEEASTILDLSPRGAAALLRLAIQRLCKHLGEKGKNIDEDIGVLVKKGLDQRVKQALDVVRVIGNNAVHPGQIDLKDDRATAEKLFGLVNLIAEIMISQPKHVEEMFDGLPESARNAIKRRDGLT